MGGKGQGEKGDGDENSGLCKLQTKEAGLSLNSYFGNTHRLHQKVPYMEDICRRKMAQTGRCLCKTGQPTQPAVFKT